MANEIEFNPGSIAQLVEALNSMEQSLGRVETAINNLAGRTQRGVFKEVFGTAQDIDEIVEGFKKLSTIGVANLDDISQAANRIVRTFKNLRAGDLKSTNIEQYSVKLRDLFEAVAALANSTRGLASFQKVEDLVNVFAQLGTGIRALAKGAGDLKPETVKKISITFSSLAPILQTVSHILSFLPGMESFSELSESFSRVGSALGTFSRSARNLNPEVILRVSASFAALSAALQSIAGMLQFIPGRKALTELSESFKNVAEAINLFLRINKEQTNIPQIAKTLTLFTFAITPFIKSLKGLSNDNIPNLKDFGEGFSFLVTSLDGLEDDKVRNFKNFNKFTKEIANGLNEFVRVKVDPDRLRAIGEALRDLGDFTKSLSSSLKEDNVSQTGSQVGFDLVGDIARGVELGLTRFQIGEMIVNAITYTLREFNPVSLLNKTYRAFDSFFDSISSRVREFGNNLRQIGDDLFDMGERLLSGPFSITGIMNSSSFGLAADFDQLSSQLQVFGGLTEEQTRKAQEFANTIGIDYPLSSNEALGSILDLIKAGQDLSSVEFILPAAADLAALSDTGSIETTTQILIGAASSFKQFTDEVTGTYDNIAIAANLLTAGADVSTASVESLGEGLGNVQAVASAFGLSMEETIGVLGIFDNASVKGAEGGTLLRSVLNSLQSTRASDELARLGYNIDEIMNTAEGSRRPLNEIINQLRDIVYFNDSGERLSEAESAEILANLADTYGRTGLAILLGQDADALDTFTAAMNESGTASEKAGKLLDNFKGDLEQLQGSAETLMTRAMLPLLNNIFRPLVQVSRSVVDALLGLPDAFFEITANVVGLVSGGLSLAGVFGVVGGVMLKVSGVLISVAGWFAGLLFNIIPLVTAIGAVAASFAVIVAAGLVLIPTLVAIGAGMKAVRDAITNNIGGAGDAFQRLKDSINSVVEAVSNVISAVGNILAPLRDSFTGPQGAIALGTGIASVFDTLAKKISTATQPFRDFAEGAALASGLFRDWLGLGDEAQGIANEVNAALNNLGTGFEGTAEATDYAGEVLDRYRDRLEEASKSPLMQKIFGDDNLTPEKIIANFTAFKLGIDNVGSSIVQIAGAIPKLLFGDDDAKAVVIDNLSNILEQATRFIQFYTKWDLSEALLKFRQGKLSEGVNVLVSNLFSSLREKFLANSDKLEDLAKNLVSFLIPGSLLTKVLDAIGLDSLANAIRAIVAPIQDFAKNTIGTIFDVLRGQTLVEALIGNFGDKQGLAIAKVFRELGRVFENLSSIFEEIVDVLFPGSTSRDSILTTAFEGIANGLQFLNDVILYGVLRVIRPLAEGFRSLLNVISNVAPAFFELLDGTILTFIRSVFQEGDILGGLQKAFNGLITGFPNLLGTLAASILGMDMANEERSISEAVLDKIANGIRAIPNMIAMGLFDLGISLQGDNPIVASFLNQLALAIANGEYLHALRLIAINVLGLISSAIQSIPGLVANGLFQLSATTTNPIFAEFLADLAENIAQGDFFGAIATIATNIIGVLQRAVASVGTFIGSGLFSLASTSQNEAISSLLISLGQAISSGNYLEAIGIIAGNIIGVLGRALASIPSLLTSGINSLAGSTDDPAISAFLNNLAASITKGDYVGAIGSLAGGLIGFLVRAVREIPTLLASGVGSLTSNDVAGVGTFLEGFADAIRGGNYYAAITYLGNAIAQLIRDGLNTAISLLGTGLTGLGELTDNPFMESIGESLTQGNFGSIFDNVGNALLTLLSDAISGIGWFTGSAFETMGQTIGSAFLTELGGQLKDGDFLGAIGTLAEGLVSLLVSAIQAIPEVIGSLGETLGLPFLTHIATALKEGNFAYAYRLIGWEIGNVISGAIQWLGDQLGISPDISGIFAFIARAFVGLKTEVFAVPIDIIQGLVDLVRNLGALKDLLGGPNGIVFAVGMGLVATKMGLLNTAITALGGAATSLLSSPLVQAAAIILLLKSALTGLNTALEEGSALRGIGAALIDLGATALGFLGIDVDVEALNTTWTQILYIIEDGLRSITNVIGTAFQRILDGIASGFNAAILGIIGGIADTGILDDTVEQNIKNLRDAFFELNTILSTSGPENGGLSFFQSISEQIAKAGPEDITSLAQLLRLNATRVLDEFSKLDLSELTPADLPSLAEALILSDNVGQGVARFTQENPDLLLPLMQSLMENAALGLNFQDVLDNITSIAMGGDLDREAVVNTAIQFAVNGQITKEQAMASTQAIIDQLLSSDIITEEQARIWLNNVEVTIDEGQAKRAAAIAAGQTFAETTISLGEENGIPVELTFTPVPITDAKTQDEFLTLMEETYGEAFWQGLRLEGGGVNLDFIGLALSNLTTGLVAGTVDQSYVDGFISQINQSLPTHLRINPETLTLEPAQVEVEVPPTAIPTDGEPARVPVDEVVVTPNTVTVDTSEVVAGTDAGDEETTPPVPVEIPIEVATLVTNPEEAIEQATKAIEEQYAANPASLIPLDDVQVSDATEAAVFAANMALLRDRSVEVKEALLGLNTESSRLGIELPVNTALAYESWLLNITPVTTEAGIWAENLRGVQHAITGIANQLNIHTGPMTEKLALIGAAFSSMVDAAMTPLERLATKVGDLAMEIGNLGAAADAAGGGAQPGGAPQGRAKGGPVFAGSLYEVAENGMSELLRIGNRTYLIPGANGFVVPMSAPPVTANSGAGGSSVTNNSSQNVSIVINTDGSANPNSIARAVREELERMGRTNNVSRRLTVTGTA